MNDGDDILQEF